MNKEAIQEEEYEFPYHHLIAINPFSETRHLFWGYQYAAYIEKIIENLRNHSFNSLIEIGCGDGKVLTEIARALPNKKYMGVDYSEKSLRFARAFSPHLSFQVQTKEKFDAFILVEVIEHINPVHMDSFLDSICANLHDKAFGIITTPCDNVPVNPKHYQHFNKDSIDKTLGKHFEILSFEYVSANTVGVKLIQRLLANKFFILNNRVIINRLYKLYKKYYLNASSRNAAQVFVIVRKKVH